MKKELCLLLILACDCGLCDLPCLTHPGAPGESDVCVCSSHYCDTVERPSTLPRGRFFHYFTSKAHPGFSHSAGYFKSDSSFDATDILFVINSTIQYQQILGFGGSFTDTSGLLISSLPEKAQQHFIESYFGVTGIEYSLCRMPIGGSDFSSTWYTLADTPDDKDLRFFSLQEEDYKYKIPYIKRAMAVSQRGVSLIACPWTAPQWMKTKNTHSNNLAGYLKVEHFQTWATYYVKFLKAYMDTGINIWAISGTNEPMLYLTLKTPLNNTVALSQDQRWWLKHHLSPQLRAANLSHVKFLTFEEWRMFALHWMDRFSADPEAFELVEGIAIHWYSDYRFGHVDVMDELHYRFPDKLILYTEASINKMFDKTSNAVKLGSWNRAALYIYHIIENLNHWASSFIDWNLALNTEWGPTIRFPIDAAVLVNSTSGEFYKQPIFYAMGHFSKFIPPGSRRVHVQVIESSGFQADPGKIQTYPLEAPGVVYCLATSNSDGSSTAVVFNNKNKTVRIRLEVPQLGSLTMDIEKHSINTFVYWL